jgi:hypothetical protein
MNNLFIRPNMQLTSDRCFYKIIVKVKKTYNSLAVWRDIYLSLPKTEEIVSSTKDRIDFLSILLDEDILTVFYILIPDVPLAVFLI